MTVPENQAWPDEEELDDNADYCSEFAENEDENQWSCEFPGNCCMPGYHMRSECHTPQMAEAWFKEEEAA